MNWLLRFINIKGLLGIGLVAGITLLGFRLYTERLLNSHLKATNKQLLKTVSSCKATNEISKLYCNSFKVPIDLTTYVKGEDNETITYDFSKLTNSK